MGKEEEIHKELKEIKLLLRELTRQVIRGEEVPSITSKLLGDDKSHVDRTVEIGFLDE